MPHSGGDFASLGRRGRLTRSAVDTLVASSARGSLTKKRERPRPPVGVGMSPPVSRASKCEDVPGNGMDEASIRRRDVWRRNGVACIRVAQMHERPGMMVICQSLARDFGQGKPRREAVIHTTYQQNRAVDVLDLNCRALNRRSMAHRGEIAGNKGDRRVSLTPIHARVAIKQVRDRLTAQCPGRVRVACTWLRVANGTHDQAARHHAYDRTGTRECGADQKSQLAATRNSFDCTEIAGRSSGQSRNRSLR